MGPQWTSELGKKLLDVGGVRLVRLASSIFRAVTTWCVCLFSVCQEGRTASRNQRVSFRYIPSVPLGASLVCLCAVSYPIKGH